MLGDSSGKGFKLPYIFDLSETAWKVVLALLIERKPIGPREIAKKLGMKSHSGAIYHLTKLMEHNIVEKTTYGDYQINPEADLNFIHQILFVKHRMIPYSQILFGTLFAGFFFIYLLLVGFDETIQSGFIAVLCMIGAGLWFTEAYRTWYMSGFMPANI